LRLAIAQRDRTAGRQFAQQLFAPCRRRAGGLAQPLPNPLCDRCGGEPGQQVGQRLAADFEQVVLGQRLDRVAGVARRVGDERRQARARPLQRGADIGERRAVAGDHEPHTK
jgi:hypothetical protein